MGISFWQILLIVIVVVLLFGAGKIPRLMGDVAKGIKSFRSGLKDDDKADEDDAQGQTVQRQIEGTSDAVSGGTQASTARNDERART